MHEGAYLAGHTLNYLVCHFIYTPLQVIYTLLPTGATIACSQNVEDRVRETGTDDGVYLITSDNTLVMYVHRFVPEQVCECACGMNLLCSNCNLRRR